MRSPSEVIVTNNAQFLSGLIDQLAQLLRTVYDVLPLIAVFSLDGLSDLGVFPRSSEVKFASPFELLLGFNQGVEDPFTILERNVGAESTSSLVEGMNLLLSKLSVEDHEVLARSGRKYIRDWRLPVKRLLFIKRLLATNSLAPYRGLQVK
jgi:hypothetical protein